MFKPLNFLRVLTLYRKGADTITWAYITGENDIENYKSPVTMFFIIFFNIDLISFVTVNRYVPIDSSLNENVLSSLLLSVFVLHCCHCLITSCISKTIFAVSENRTALK